MNLPLTLVSWRFQKVTKVSKYAITSYFFCLEEMNTVFQLYSSLWGKRANVLFILKGIKIKMLGEGNGTPLQCSCLENPMDGGAWWAAVHGVAKGRTRLK